MSVEHEDFYLQFENRFRGSSELITARLKAYLPFVTYLKEAFDEDILGADLGCGRGEWLELLQTQEVTATGVDRDPGMLKLCRDRGLSIADSDALDYLQSSPKESFHMLTAFHIVEHLEFNKLLHLIAEAFRCLKPGGILVMETPNPENIVIGSCNFYIDPTHLHPIPPPLLAFATEYSGFQPPTVLRLQEAQSFADGEVALEDVFFGPSPDYAIVAVKTGTEAQAALLAQHHKEYPGVGIKQIAQRYDENIHQRFASMEQLVADRQEELTLGTLKEHLSEMKSELVAQAGKSAQLQNQLTRLGENYDKRTLELKQAQIQVETYTELGEKLQEATKHVDRLQAEVEELQGHSHHWWSAAAQATTQAEQLQTEVAELQGHSHHWWSTAEAAQAELKALRSSWSWRITAPLRGTINLAMGMAELLRAFIRLCFAFLAGLLRAPLRWAIQWALARPRLVNALYPTLLRFPWLRKKLEEFAHREDLLAAPPEVVNTEPLPVLDDEDAIPGTSARSQRIYKRLKRQQNERS